jgi:hypothetical protein
MRDEHNTCVVINHIPHDLIYSEDCANVDTRVNVAASVKRIKYDAILSLVLVFNDDGLFELFRDEDSRLARRTKGINHDIIRKYVQFLLFFALYIGVSGQADSKSVEVNDFHQDVSMRAGGRNEQIDQAGLAHIGGNELGRETNGIEKKSQIARRGRTKTNLLG